MLVTETHDLVCKIYSCVVY